MEPALERIRDELRSIQRLPGLSRIGLGVRRLDHELWKHGRARLDAHRANGAGAPSRQAGDGPDVYLASHVYDQGGHTALIGDFVQARRDHATGAHLILTNASKKDPPALTAEALARTGIPQERTTSLQGVSLDDRLDALLARLLELGPGRLFLFHHHDDPVAVAACQAEICADCVLVHHNDGRPSFGLHMPDITLIELNPLGAAIARAQRLSPELLPLTCPDPGPRPHGFLRNGALVTATSGTPLKFDGDYAYTYPEAIALILKTTGGRHIHIGPLNDELTGGIDQALRREGIDPRGFVHRPWVPSVAKALWDCDCDVYVASFPTDGARALVEVAASGTPYLAHTRRPHRNPENDPMTGAGTGWWRNWDELEARLGELSDRRRLETRSEQMRQRYMRFHHPSVFERTLDDILAGKEGLADPQAAGRDRAMLALITAALADDVIEESAVSRNALGAFRRDSDAFRRDIEASATRFRAGEEAARSAVEGNLLKAIGQSDRATSEKVERLAGEQATLAEAHGRLSEAHGRLGEAHRQSREGHGRLSEAHRRLGESHRQLQEAHRRLGESHRQLREAHGKLSEAHTQLIKKHKRFVRRFNRIIRTSREKRRRGILGWFGRGRG